MKNISAWAIRHPVTPIVLFAVLCFMGLVSFNRLPLTPWPRNRLTVNRIHEAHRAPWACPIWFFSEAWWQTQVEKLGLAITLRWTAPEDTVTIDGERHEFQGMVLSKQHPPVP